MLKKRKTQPAAPTAQPDPVRQQLIRDLRATRGALEAFTIQGELARYDAMRRGQEGGAR